MMVIKERLISEYNMLEQKLYEVEEKYAEEILFYDCEDCEDVQSFGYPCRGCCKEAEEKYQRLRRNIEKKMLKIKNKVEKIEKEELYI